MHESPAGLIYDATTNSCFVMQALSDGEVSVVCDAVKCVAAVAPHLRKRSLMHAARKVRLEHVFAVALACSMAAIAILLANDVQLTGIVSTISGFEMVF